MRTCGDCGVSLEGDLVLTGEDPPEFGDQGASGATYDVMAGGRRIGWAHSSGRAQCDACETTYMGRR